MGIIKKNKNVIGVIKNGHPVTKIYKGNFLYYNAIPEFDIDLEFKEINGSYGKAFKINDVSITPTSSTYQANLADLGIESVTSFNFFDTNLSKINRFPDCATVTTLPQQPFAYTKLGYLDTASFNLTNLTSADFLYAYMYDVVGIKAAVLSSDITSYQGYYGGCSSLKSASFPVGSRINNISYLFYDCEALTDVGLFPMYTSVENASNLFNGCSSLDFQSLLANSTYNGFKQMFKFSPIKNVSSMFQGCNFGNSAFDSSYLSEWQMNYVEDASYLFANTNASDFQLYYWDMWRCKNWSHMFENCNSISSISFSNKDFAGAEDFSYMFANCSNLSYVSFVSVNNLTGVTNFEGMFSGCYSLQTVECDDCGVYDLLKQALESSGLDVGILQDTSGNCGGSSGGLTDRITVFMQPQSSGAYVQIDYTNYEAENWNDSTLLCNTTLSELGASSEFQSLVINGNVESIISLPSSTVDWALGISNCENLKYCDLSKVDKTNLHTVYDFFEGCTSLMHIDLSNWSDGQIWSESGSNGVFFDCSSLKTIKMLNCSDNIKTWVSDKLSAQGMTDQVVIITEENNTYITYDSDEGVNIKINGDYVTTMGENPFPMQNYGLSVDGNSIHNMFEYNYSLKSVYNMPSLSSTTGHWNMFGGCTSLTYVDLSSWDFDFNNGDQDCVSMFSSCSSMEWVNFSGWDLTNAYNEDSMLQNCSNLKYVFAFGCNDATISKLEAAINNSYSNNSVTLIR